MHLLPAKAGVPGSLEAHAWVCIALPTEPGAPGRSAHFSVHLMPTKVGAPSSWCSQFAGNARFGVILAKIGALALSGAFFSCNGVDIVRR